MIKIDMDNEKRYTFDNYGNYFVNNEYLVIEDAAGAWIGCFTLEHMIGAFVEEDNEILR